jgi:hypothetical protein
MSLSTDGKFTNITVHVDHYTANDCNLEVYNNGVFEADEYVTRDVADRLIAQAQANGATVFFSRR